MIRRDGIRSDGKVWFANKLLSQLDGDGRKSSEIAGFSVRVWRDGDYDGGTIEAPPGVFVVSATATGIDVYLSEPIGAPGQKTQASDAARYPAYWDWRPMIALAPYANDFVDMNFSRTPVGGGVIGDNYARRLCVPGTPGVTLIGTGTITNGLPQYGLVVSTPQMRLLILDMTDGFYFAAVTTSGLSDGRIGLAELISAEPTATSASFVTATRVDDVDVRVFLTLSTPGGYVRMQLSILLLESGAIGVYFVDAGYPGIFLYGPFAFRNILDQSTTFQDDLGRLYSMDVNGDCVRSEVAGGYTSITLPVYPFGSIGQGHIHETTLVNGGLYLHQYWMRNISAPPANLGGVLGYARVGSPLTGAWEALTLPAGDIRKLTPLLLSADRRVLMALSYVADVGTKAWFLDTDVSLDWRGFVLTEDRIEAGAMTVYGSHPYADLMRNQASVQWVMEA